MATKDETKTEAYGMYTTQEVITQAFKVAVSIATTT